MTVTLADLAAIPISTSVMAREYLFTNLTNVLPSDTDNGSSLQVIYDAGGEYEADDIVSVGDVVLDYEFGAFVGSGGAGWLRERYSVTVTIDVFRGGDNAQMTYTRAQYLADLVCALVRYDPQFGTGTNVAPQPQIITATPKSSSVESEWDDEHLGRHSVATVEISIFAQR
jgi:hypothetical protein